MTWQPLVTSDKIGTIQGIIVWINNERDKEKVGEVKQIT